MKKSTRHLCDDSGLIEGSRGAFFGEKTAKNKANQARLPWKRKINIREPFKSSNCKGVHFKTSEKEAQK